MSNSALLNAKTNKNDEFYTLISDIDEELEHYEDFFEGAVVYCNTDDFYKSNFAKYFIENFKRLGLKKLICTAYSEFSYKVEVVDVIDGQPVFADVLLERLKGNGDFRSEECVALLKEADIIVTNPPFSCYSEDTEVLTDAGWKLFEDVEKTDKILSVDINSREFKYVSIRRFYKKEVNDYLLHFHKRGMDFLVTDNHRMIVDNSFVYAREVRGKLPVKFFQYQNNNTVKEFVLPAAFQKEQYTRKGKSVKAKRIDIKHWLEFFGFWIADGYCRTGTRYVTGIKQNKANDAYVKQIFDNIGFPCKVYKNNTGNNNYEVYSKQLWSYLRQFGGSTERFIPRWILNLNKELLYYLLKGYLKGDSSCINDKMVLGSVSRQLCDDIAELVLKVEGRIINFIPTKSKGNPFWKASYSLKNQSRFNIIYPEPEKVPYEGNIYCLELEENHTMLVRRNFISNWSGNSFRDYMNLLIKYDKKFIILGNQNALTCKEIFPLIRDRKIWLGVTKKGSNCWFELPDHYTKWHKIKNGKKYAQVNTITWFTNIDHGVKNPSLQLKEKYDDYNFVLYDNYDAVEISKVKDIPAGPVEVIVDEERLESLKKTYPDLEIMEILDED